MLSRLSTRTWIFVILIATALQWIGGSAIGLATDDYHYIHHLAPIANVGDVFAAFVKSDANPQYWRPLANATLSADFLLFKWQGGGYHITNLLFHLIATTLVYFACRRVFSLDAAVSLVATAIFGLSCGHDSNLLWIAARADILVTIFALSTLLLLKLDGWTKQISLFAYFLALCSKELAVLLLPIIAVLAYSDERDRTVGRRSLNSLFTLLPFMAVTALFIYLRSSFTVGVEDAQPMLGEGMRSPIAAIKNIGYGAAYLFFPVDLATAATLLTRYKLEATVAALAALVAFVALFRKHLLTIDRKQLLLPILVFLCLSFVAAQSFERWRLYAPSVGLYALASIIAVHLFRTGRTMHRIAIGALALMMLSFHVYRAHEEQLSWRLASGLLHSVNEDLKPILSRRGDAPLLLLTRPSKIGGGSVMKISTSKIVLQAKAELQRPSENALGGVGDLRVDLEHCLLVVALDPREAITKVTVEKLSDNVYRVIVPRSSSTRLQPESIAVGSTPRGRGLVQGDTLQTPAGAVIINESDRTFATDVTVHLRPTTRIPLYFDGRSMRELLPIRE